MRASERLSLRVWATPLEPHPRGRQFTVRTEARVGEELVWEESSTRPAAHRYTEEPQTCLPRQANTLRGLLATDFLAHQPTGLSFVL